MSLYVTKHPFINATAAKKPDDNYDDNDDNYRHYFIACRGVAKKRAFILQGSADSALLHAIQSRDLSKVAALLAGYPAQPTSPCPLHYACHLGYPEIIAELLKYSFCRAAINEFDDISYTPLMYAAKHGDVGLVDLLITAGADVNARDEARIGNTVLREIIETAGPTMVKALLDRGADPHIEGWMQLSAIDKANERYEQERSVDAAAIVHLVSRGR